MGRSGGAAKRRNTVKASASRGATRAKVQNLELEERLFEEAKIVEEAKVEWILSREKQCQELAGDFHDEWRESRRVEYGDFFEPRIKPTTDAEWVKEHGTDQVDIANTKYEDLPRDWQAENRAAAEAAFDAISKAKTVEEAASMIHDAWLERNGEWAEEHQKVPYSELSEEEKEKDRAQALAALEKSSQYQTDLTQESIDKQKNYPNRLYILESDEIYQLDSDNKDFDLDSEIDSMASDLHEEWRRPRSLEFEPRIKKTTDEKWIKENGTDQVDIANTDFNDLPSDWQEENMAAAVAVTNAVEQSPTVESAAAKVHDAWLDRHGREEWVKEAGLDVPYDQLPAEEKEKDRSQVMTMLRKKGRFGRFKNDLIIPRRIQAPQPKWGPEELPIVAGGKIYTKKRRSVKIKDGIFAKPKGFIEIYWEDQDGKEVPEETVILDVAHDVNAHYEGQKPAPLEAIYPNAQVLPKGTSRLICGPKIYRQKERIPPGWDKETHGTAQPEKYWVSEDGEELSAEEMDEQMKIHRNARYLY